MKRLAALWKDADKLVVVLLTLWLALDLIQAAYTGLSSREIYYWHLACDLPDGGSELPPLFAWLIRLGIFIGGNDSPFWIRLPFLLFQPAALCLLWRLLRTPRPERRTVFVFLLTAFTIPLLQLGGTAASPAGPLLFFTCASLFAFRYLLRAAGQTSRPTAETITGSVLLTLSLAGLFYTHYLCAVTVTVALLLANRSVWKNRWFLATLAGVAALLVPLGFLLAEHQWIAFQYAFTSLHAPSLYTAAGSLLWFILLLNPLWMSLFLVYLIRQKMSLPAERAIRMTGWGISLLTLIGGLFTDHTALWSIPAIPTLLYILTRNARIRPALYHALLRIGTFLLIIFTGLRIFIICYTGDRIPTEIFNAERKAFALHSQTGGKSLVTTQNAADLAYSYRYYTRTPSFVDSSDPNNLPDLTIHDEIALYGLPAAVELAEYMTDSIRQGSVSAAPFLQFRYPGMPQPFYYDTVSFYIPTRRVEIQTTPSVPRKVMTGQSIPVVMNVRNPYAFEIPLQSPAATEGFTFSILLKTPDGAFIQSPLTIDPVHTFLPANGTVQIRTRLIIPKEIDSGIYRFGITLHRPPFGSAYNSLTETVHIVNPRRAF